MDLAKELFFAQQTLMTLFLVTNKLQMQGDKHLQELTLRQMLAIPALVHAPDGKASINHLARSMGTTKQSAKQIVDIMVKKGFVSVAPSEQDKRAVHVTVTPEGQQAFKICSERTDEFLAMLFESFTTEDLETLCTLLQKLYRFNDPTQEGLNEYSHYNTSVADDILRHHPNFAIQRTQTYTKESD